MTWAPGEETKTITFTTDMNQTSIKSAAQTLVIWMWLCLSTPSKEESGTRGESPCSSTGGGVVKSVLHHRNETHSIPRFHETILSFGEPGSLGFLSMAFLLGSCFLMFTYSYSAYAKGNNVCFFWNIFVWCVLISLSSPFFLKICFPLWLGEHVFQMGGEKTCPTSTQNLTSGWTLIL